MVTTVSQLRVGDAIMSSKHHTTFYSSTRQFSSNNFFFLKKKKFYENGPKFPKLRLVFSKDHSILRSELSNNCSKANIFPPPSLQKKPLKSRNTCSIHNLFGDDFIFHGPLISVLEKLSTKFASLLLLGVLTMMITALVSRDSAIAASYGRMGGGGSDSYSSCSYRSSSGSSRSFCYYPSYYPSGSEETYVLRVLMVFMLTIISVWSLCMLDDASVLMLQVGISDENQELLRKLNRIPQTADLSTPRGLINILNEVSKALRQHYDSCHFAYFFEKYNHTKELLVKPCYKKLVIRERAIYAKETFTNVDGAKSKTTVVDKANSIDHEYTVVTLLVLVRGKFLFPSWRVERALQTFCSIPIRNIQTVQVLWNPLIEGETLSEQQLRKDYPLMKRYKTVAEEMSL